MKILWLSDDPHRLSGFGIASGELCRRLAARGCDISFLAWWSDRSPGRFFGLPVEPCPVSPQPASAKLVEWLDRTKADYLVTLGDIPWLSWMAGGEVLDALTRNDTRWCCYFPVDGVLADGTLPAPWRRVLRCADLTVTMSGFGAAACALSGIRAVTLPHGCDTSLFKPPACKEGAKRRLGWDGKFVVLADARNHRRKLLPRLLDIVRHADLPAKRFLLYLHTNLRTGEDLDSYAYDVAADVGLSGLAGHVRLSGEGDYGRLAAPDLAKLYAAADVHLLASYGEGFGLPTLQAASSGVVSIAGDHSATRELLEDHGFAIPASHSAEDEYGLVRPFIDRDAAASTLRRLAGSPALLAERSRAGRDFALRYDWRHIARDWDALLRRQLQRPIGGRVRHPRATMPASAPGRALARPTGHDPDMLPPPRIEMPTRLRKPGGTQSRLILVASAACRQSISPVRALFPGLRIALPTARMKRSRPALLTEMMGALVVVDPAETLLPDADLICALAGISFIGGGRFWPRVPAANLLFQVRMLLTDHALAAQRAIEARGEAERYCARRSAEADWRAFA